MKGSDHRNSCRRAVGRRDARIWARSGVNISAHHGGRQLLSAIHVVKANVQAVGGRKLDQPSGHIGHQNLTALQMDDVALRASKAIGQRFLSDTEAFSDRLKVVHPSILVGLILSVNSRTVCAR